MKVITDIAVTTSSTLKEPVNYSSTAMKWFLRACFWGAGVHPSNCGQSSAAKNFPTFKRYYGAPSSPPAHRWQWLRHQRWPTIFLQTTSPLIHWGTLPTFILKSSMEYNSLCLDIWTTPNCTCTLFNVFTEYRRPSLQNTGKCSRQNTPTEDINYLISKTPLVF